MPRILITGGAGFIGSHVARHLNSVGEHEVILLDSFGYGSQENLGNELSNLQVYKKELGQASYEELVEVCEGVDYIIHLAAEKHNQSRDQADRLLRANIEGFYSLLEAAGQGGVKKIVFSSSLYVYGIHSTSNRSESSPACPDTLYGISKLTGEQLLACMAAKYGFDYNILRYYFVYGPYQFAGSGYKSVIVKNFENILAKRPVTICGDGTQELDYIYVDDVVGGTIQALFSQCSGEIFNISRGEGVSVLSLTEKMLEISHSQVDVEYIEKDWTAGTRRVGENAKICSVLDWKPLISLEDGLRNTFEWMKKVYVAN